MSQGDGEGGTTRHEANWMGDDDSTIHRPGQQQRGGDDPFEDGTPTVPGLNLLSDSEPSTHPGGDEASTGPGTGASTRRGTRSFGDDAEFIGQIVSGYKVESLLGSGGNARVFLGRNPRTGREVAIKVFGRSDDKSSYARFMREAEVVVGIRHPNVVSCYGIGEFKGRAYMVLEMMPGGDLSEYLERFGGRLDLERGLRMAIDIAKGLQEVHNAGYIHRDIKPGNIFISKDGVAKIGDLGLAHRMATDASAETAQRAAGTPAFMSPEQARGDGEIDIRSDIYSLGATLFYIITGRPPYTGKSSYDVVDKILNEQPPDPKLYAAGIPDGVAEVVNVCLFKQQAHRYSSVQELVSDLTSLLGAKAPTRAFHRRAAREEVARREDAVKQRQETWRKWRVHFVASAMLAVFLVGVLVLVALPTPEERRAALEQAAIEQAGARLLVDWGREGLLALDQTGPSAIPLADGVELRGGALVYPDASGLSETLREYGTFTVELDLTLTDLQQSGPARILSIAGGIGARNLTIGQLHDRYEVRVRTTRTTPNGLQPHQVSPAGAVVSGRQLLTLVRALGWQRLFVNGELVSEERIDGELDTWETRFPLHLGNEIDGRFPWRGELHRVRIYAGAKTDEQIREDHRAWLREHPASAPAREVAVGE